MVDTLLTLCPSFPSGELASFCLWWLVRLSLLSFPLSLAWGAENFCLGGWRRLPEGDLVPCGGLEANMWAPGFTPPVGRLEGSGWEKP